MDPLVLIIIVVCVVGLLWLIRPRRERRVRLAIPQIYKRRAVLFTRAERSFLGVLDQAAGSDYRVLGKVRVADVVKVSQTINRSAWQIAFNKISGKHFDFVLADPGTLEVRAVIELNDKSHRSEKRAARDDFIRYVCADAELRLIEVDAKRTYSVAEVRELIAEPVLEEPDSDGRVAPTIN